jgi:hypothetical protein
MKKKVSDIAAQKSTFNLGVLFKLLESRIFLACLFCIAVGYAIVIVCTNKGFLLPRSALDLLLDFLFGLCVLVSAATLRSLIPLIWQSMSIVKRIISLIMYVGLILMLAAFLQGFVVRTRHWQSHSRYENPYRIMSVLVAVLGVYRIYYESHGKRIRKKRAK